MGLKVEKYKVRLESFYKQKGDGAGGNRHDECNRQRRTRVLPGFLLGGPNEVQVFAKYFINPHNFNLFQRQEDEEQFAQLSFKVHSHQNFKQFIFLQMMCGTEPFPEHFRAKKYKIHKKFLSKQEFQLIMRNLPEHVW